MTQTKGRCWTCQRAYEWPAGRTRRLVSMRCPKCAGPLQKTSHQYRGAFRPIAPSVADMIAAGVYDDFGVGAWKR